MRAGLCLLAAAGLLLGGCATIWPTGKAVQADGPAPREATNGTPTAGAAPPAAWYARSNGANCAAWDQNAYHYECDPNANY